MPEKNNMKTDIFTKCLQTGTLQQMSRRRTKQVVNRTADYVACK